MKVEFHYLLQFQGPLMLAHCQDGNLAAPSLMLFPYKLTVTNILEDILVHWHKNKLRTDDSVMEQNTERSPRLTSPGFAAFLIYTPLSNKSLCILDKTSNSKMSASTRYQALLGTPLSSKLKQWKEQTTLYKLWSLQIYSREESEPQAYRMFHRNPCGQQSPLKWETLQYISQRHETQSVVCATKS